MGRGSTGAVAARVLFALAVLGLGVGAAFLSFGYGERARLAPLLTAIPLTALMVAILVREVLDRRKPPAQSTAPVSEPRDKAGADDRASPTSGSEGGSGSGASPTATASDRPALGTYWQALLSLAVLLVVFYVLGSIAAAIVYAPLHLAIVGRFSIWAALGTSLVSAALIWLVVDTLLNVHLYGGLL